MTTVTVKTDGSKKSITLGSKTYELELAGNGDLDFMADKDGADPVVEMLAKAYELGMNKEPVIFVQK